MEEVLRQLTILVLGIGAMSSVYGVLVGVVTAVGPGKDTMQWGTIAVVSSLVMTACFYALGALGA